MKRLLLILTTLVALACSAQEKETGKYPGLHQNDGLQT